MIDEFKQRIAAGKPLCIRGAGSKEWYGNPPQGELLDTRTYRGIVAYEPTELYLTARCGTPLVEVEASLNEKGQCLAFEPPRFSPDSTLGGVVAAGLSGPRRVSAGALRDFVLGVKILDGEACELNFGGQVMKNVAGYDVSRLMAGSLGTLCLITEVTLKVLPRPVAETTLQFAMTQSEALDRLNRWAGQPLPIVASAWCAGLLTLRLAGARAAVSAAQIKLGGEKVDADGTAFWNDLRDQRLPFFTADTLWRLSVPSTTPTLDLPGEMFIEWGGALRWLQTSAPAEAVRRAAVAVGGSATLYRGQDLLKAQVGAFAPLAPVSLQLHHRLKSAFDPRGIFNPGRLYKEF